MTGKKGRVIRRPGNSKSARSHGPRLSAAKLLAEWFSEEPIKRPPLDEEADRYLCKLQLSHSDAALFWEIIFGTVRWRRLLEWHVKKHVSKWSRLPLPVKMVFLTGCYQIIFLSRIPMFAAVNEAVNAVRTLGCSWAGGLVNAVLRKVSTSSHVIPGDDAFFEKRCAKNFLNCLSVFSSHAHWMAKRWVHQWGRKTAISICMENNLRPPLSLRVNRLKTTRAELLSLFEEHAIKAEKGYVSPDSLLIKDYRGRVEKLPGFSEGLFQVQDESSQIASMLLNPRPGLRVLDMCAGVGGKSGHIAALMENTGLLICSDTSMKRLERLRENASRLGMTLMEPLPLAQARQMIRSSHIRFDRILVDAPCSGTGVIRRHPDIKWTRTPGTLEGLVKIQQNLLQEASGLLGPQGILVYSVCSLEKEEGETLVENFLRTNEGFHVLRADTIIPGLPGDMVTREGFFRTLPGICGMDGFFSAVITRNKPVNDIDPSGSWE